MNKTAEELFTLGFMNFLQKVAFKPLTTKAFKKAQQGVIKSTMANLVKSSPGSRIIPKKARNVVSSISNPIKGKPIASAPPSAASKNYDKMVKPTHATSDPSAGFRKRLLKDAPPSVLEGTKANARLKLDKVVKMKKQRVRKPKAQRQQIHKNQLSKKQHPKMDTMRNGGMASSQDRGSAAAAAIPVTVGAAMLAAGDDRK